MKKDIIYLFFFVVALLIVPVTASAVGLGVYGSYDFSENVMKEEGTSLWSDSVYSKRYVGKSHRGDFGIVIDTAVARDQLFNYRLNIGGGFGVVDVKRTRKDLLNWMNPSSTATWHFNIYDIQMFHTFGFGVVRTETVRFWIGPQFGFGYAGKDYGQVYLKIGPVLGINLNIGDVFTLFMDAGFRFNVSAAKVPALSLGYGGFAEVGMLFPHQ